MEKSQIVSVASTGKSVLEPGGTRLFEDPYCMWTGCAAEAVRGLENRMRVNHEIFFQRVAQQEKSIENELRLFASLSTAAVQAEVSEWLDYIIYEVTSEKEYPNGIRDHGRVGLALEYFFQHEVATAAHLSKAEILALRIYSTPLFKYINNPLRDEERYQKGNPCPWPVTTYFANQGIRKLRAVSQGSTQRATFPITLWPGMRNLKIAEDFQQDGVTEMAFMSTTSDLRVAVCYSLSKSALLFKIRVRNLASSGADLKWVSVFPSESEVLYSPLTFLHPTGRTEEILVEHNGSTLSFNVVEVEPFCF